MKTLSAAIIILLYSCSCKAQATISGSQRRIPDANAELASETVKIKRAAVIDSVSGFHNGFWIVKNSKPEKAFWTERFARTALGYELKPATYSVYPNLKKDSDTASVTIWLKYK